MDSYLPVAILMAISFGLGTIIILLPMLIAPRKAYHDKNSQYECGFKGFGSVRKKFDVRFYLISMLFIVFDLEIAFLFPWAIVLKTIGYTGFISMMVFLGILIIGFIYEWKKGALDS